MVPLTGKGAEWGQAAKISMDIAVDEINAKGGVGGVPIDLICYDTQTLEAEGLKTVSRLVERDKVLAISGPCFSSVFETIAPQLDQLKTVINSYCSAKPGLSDMSNWAFRNTLTSDKQLKPVVAAWVKEYQPKKVVIIYDAEDAVSKAEGVKILPALLKAQWRRGARLVDLPHQGHRLFGAGHQGKSAGRRRYRAGRLLPERRRHRQGDAGSKGSTCRSSPAPAPSTQGFIDIAGKAAEGAYMSTAAWIDDPRPEAAAYLKKYPGEERQQAAQLRRSARLRQSSMLTSTASNLRRHQQADRSRLPTAITSGTVSPG